AVALDGARERREVLERMELALAREADAGPGVEGVDGRARHRLHALDARALGRGELVVEHLRVPVGRKEEEAVEPLEVALDRLAPRDALDRVDRPGMALRREPGPVF